MKTKATLIITIILLILISFLGLTIIYENGDDTMKGLILGDAAKFLLQLILIGCLGGVLSIVANNYKDQQRKIEENLEYAKLLSNRLTSAIHKVRTTRTIINADPTIEIYEEQMKDLMSAKFEINTIMYDIKQSKIIPSKNGNDQIVINALKKIEEYLRKIIREYRDELFKMKYTEYGKKSDEKEIIENLKFLKSLIEINDERDVEVGKKVKEITSYYDLLIKYIEAKEKIISVLRMEEI